MWNFEIPAPLKLFFDHVVQPNKTFDPATFEGLVTGKPCFIARTAGGTEVGSAMDAGTPYLKLILGLMGFTHIEVCVCVCYFLKIRGIEASHSIIIIIIISHSLLKMLRLVVISKVMGMANSDPSKKDDILKPKCEEAATKAAAFAFDPELKVEPAKPFEAPGGPPAAGAPLAPNSKVLYISSSPMGEHSASRKVCNALIADIKAGVEGVTVTELDLAAMTSDGSLEPYTAKRVMAKFATFGAGSALATGETMTSAGLDDGSVAEWGFTQGLIKQFSEHDVYVFGVPMWNFGIPFHLKV